MTAPAATVPASPRVATSGEVDASLRLPLFMLFGGAAFWLVLSGIFGLIASIKFHGPQFLAGPAWLTYGRVYPAWSNAFVYGFGIPAGLGVGLWILARLGRTRAVWPLLAATGAKLWHLGVFVGLMGILSGGGTGFEWFEMPRYAAMILLVAFLMIATPAFLTHSCRGRRSDHAEETNSSDGNDVRLATSAAAGALYPSQWFVLAALLWFPWIYSTAILLLQVFPVRGLAQAAIAWWFAGNLLVVWTALAGLAVSFYFLPKLTGRPLQSQYTVLFAFWTLLLFGSWVGIPAGAALPAWMPALSSAAATLTLVPMLAVASSAVQTARGAKIPCGGGPLCYTKFGLGSLVLSGVLFAASGVPQVNRVTDFTWFGTGLTQWRLYGFFGMTLFGAIYYILPRVAGVEFPFARLVRFHFWCGAAGTLLLAVPLVIGGVIQGIKLANVNLPFIDVTHSTLMFLRVSTLGETLFLLGSLLLLVNTVGLLARHYRAVCRQTYAAMVARIEPSEVRA